MEIISFKQWNINGNYDSVASCRQQTVTNVPTFLNAAVADTFGKVVILGATELHTLYTTVAQVSERDYKDSIVSNIDFTRCDARVRCDTESWFRVAITTFQILQADFDHNSLKTKKKQRPPTLHGASRWALH